MTHALDTADWKRHQLSGERQHKIFLPQKSSQKDVSQQQEFIVDKTVRHIRYSPAKRTVEPPEHIPHHFIVNRWKETKKESQRNEYKFLCNYSKSNKDFSN